MRSVLVVLAVLLFGSCSSGDDPELLEPAETTAALGEVSEPPESVAPDPGAETSFASFENYRLSYASTCGDGPHITFGTDIEVVDGAVSVVGGEEPPSVGSIEVWRDLVSAAESSGLGVLVELGDEGAPRSIEIDDPAGIDTGFCVDVSAFEDLG